MIDKECKKCKEIKSIDLFGKNRARMTGYDSYCKICRNKITKANRLNKITKYGIDMVEIFDESKNHLSDIDLSRELNGY